MWDGPLRATVRSFRVLDFRNFDDLINIARGNRWTGLASTFD